MVGRTSSMSAISIRPIRSGKNRRRASTCSAVSAVAPVRLSPSVTSSRLTLPLGKSDTETPPRTTGSSPVTARISAFTASRTEFAGMSNATIRNAQVAARIKAATASPRRLVPTGMLRTPISRDYLRCKSPTPKTGPSWRTRCHQPLALPALLQVLCDPFVTMLRPRMPEPVGSYQ